MKQKHVYALIFLGTWLCSFSLVQAKSEETSYGGIGIVCALGDAGLYIDEVIGNTPAHEAGLLSGDVIWAIDNEIASDWDLEKAVGAIKGEVGTMVVLT